MMIKELGNPKWRVRQPKKQGCPSPAPVYAQSKAHCRFFAFFLLFFLISPFPPSSCHACYELLSLRPGQGGVFSSPHCQGGALCLLGGTGSNPHPLDAARHRKDMKRPMTACENRFLVFQPTSIFGVASFHWPWAGRGGT